MRVIQCEHEASSQVRLQARHNLGLCKGSKQFGAVVSCRKARERTSSLSNEQKKTERDATAACAAPRPPGQTGSQWSV